MREGGASGFHNAGLALAGGGVVGLASAAWLLWRSGEHWSPAELLPALVLEATLAALLLGAALGVLRLVRRGSVWSGRVTVGLGVVLLLGLARWTVPAPPRANAPGKGAPTGVHTLVLVSADTFRRDHVSAYPEALVLKLTPGLETFARESVRFDRAVAPAPLTLPDHTSLLTGRLPAEHGVVVNGRRVPADLTSVPQALGEAGYRTGAFVSSSVLHGSHGLAAWFEVYRDDLDPTPGRPYLPLVSAVRRLSKRAPLLKEQGQRTVARALRWLDDIPSEAPVFLWVHLYDAHAPREGEATAVGSAWERLPQPCDYAQHPSALRGSLTRVMRRVMRAQASPERCQKRSWEVVLRDVDAYAAGVAKVDAAFVALRAGLEARGRWEDAALVFVADHGESLTEHNQWGSHQYSLYDPVLDVPLMVRAPADRSALVAGSVVESPVSTVRVAATLARLGGIAGFGQDLLGEGTVSAAPLLRAVGPLPGHGRKGNFQAACQQGPLKVLISEGGFVERYDRDADPLEVEPILDPDQPQPRPTAGADGVPDGLRLLTPAFLRPNRGEEAPKPPPLSPEDRARFAPLEACAAEALAQVEKRQDDADAELPPDVKEDLKALGYIQ